MTTETKVGLFTFIGVVLLGVSIYMLGNFSLTKSYHLFVQFTDISGLPAKASVRVNGVEVGKVKELSFEEDHVTLKITVKNGTEIFKNSKFSIAATSIIGSKFLRIDQGSRAGGVLQSGDTVQGINTGSMEDMINETMATVKELAESVNNQGSLGKDLNATMANLRTLTANMNELVASIKPFVNSSADNIETITGQLRTILARTDNLLAGVEKSEGTIGALLNDEEMKNDIKDSVTNLKSVMEDAKSMMGSMRKFRIFWNLDGYYDTKARVGVSDIALSIFPGTGYTYYRVGISNLGNKDNDLKEKDYYEANKLDARLGFYNGFLDGSIGMIRGSGGMEVMYTPFYNTEFLNMFTVRASVSDLARNREINGRKFNKANLTAGVDVKLNKYILVGAGVNDMLEVAHPYMKIGIKLEDKDIASFFGLATVAAK